LLRYGRDSDELGSSGVDGDSVVLGVLDDGNSGSVALLDDLLELEGDGVGGGTVELLGVGEPLPDGVAGELLSLGVGVLLLGGMTSDDDGVDELLDATASLLDSLDELLSADDEELNDEEPIADELGVGPLLGGSALEDGRLSLLDGGSELDIDELLDDSDVELDGAELDEELPLEYGWLLDGELDDDELLGLSDEELLLELLDEGRLDDGSLLLDDGALLVGAIDELDEGPLLDTLSDEELFETLDDGSELDDDELLLLNDDSLLDEEELLELSGEELLLELLDEGRLDDGSLLEDELVEESLDELDDELEELLLLDDELMLLELLEDDSLLNDELELLLLDDDSLLEDELDEELLDDDELDELLDDGSLDDELELLLLEGLLLLDEDELDNELDELGGTLDELDELDGHGHFGTQIFLPQIVISQQSPASCTSKCAHGSGADVLGLDDELVSQQIGTSQSSPSSIDTSCPHTNVRRCVGNRIVSPYRSGHGSKVSTVVVNPLPGGHDGSLDDPDELLSLELLDDELDDDELEDEELLDELDEEEELDELEDSALPSPSCTTSHLRLSAIHLAQPNVPAGTLSAGSQHSPDDCGWQTSGQTTPIES